MANRSSSASRCWLFVPTTAPDREPLINKVLIANRGEIAVRVARACKRLGLRSVAVYSLADKSSEHVRVADEVICIGPAPAAQSYLNSAALLEAAKHSGADGVHPGYGFLAERADFAEQVEQAGLVWIGPSPETMRTMGDKVAARRTATAANVPVLPGSPEAVADPVEGESIAAEIGYPVLVKAAAGGGGRGMRVVETPERFRERFETATEEARLAFGDGRLYVERYLQRPRHVEIQILGDGKGRTVHLGERECSIQRRHQKLVEEAPSAVVGETLRAEMGACAVTLAESVGYAGAGTVEFLLDEDGGYYFMEMNTRIQVEHPVTEMVVGVDLVAEQIAVGAGERLAIDSVEMRGHAIECRINAEHPETFRPSPGTINHLRWPTGPGVRIDTALYEGYAFPPFYDSLMAKLIVWGIDRPQAIARLERALDQTKIEGLDTTLDFHRRLVGTRAFREARLHTSLVDEMLSEPETDFRARDQSEPANP